MFSNAPYNAEIQKLPSLFSTGWIQESPWQGVSVIYISRITCFTIKLKYINIY